MVLADPIKEVWAKFPAVPVKEAWVEFPAVPIKEVWVEFSAVPLKEVWVEFPAVPIKEVRVEVRWQVCTPPISIRVSRILLHQCLVLSQRFLFWKRRSWQTLWMLWTVYLRRRMRLVTRAPMTIPLDCFHHHVEHRHCERYSCCCWTRVNRAVSYLASAPPAWSVLRWMGAVVPTRSVKVIDPRRQRGLCPSCRDISTASQRG